MNMNADMPFKILSLQSYDYI